MVVYAYQTSVITSMRFQFGLLSEYKFSVSNAFSYLYFYFFNWLTQK